MSAVSALRLPDFGSWPSQSRSASQAEGSVNKLILSVKAHAQEAASDWKSLVNALIENLAREHSEPNWDGYGALPIAAGAKQLAQAFVSLLPTYFPIPEPVADPDGELALSWDFGPRNVFTVSINESGRISYAGLVGDRGKRHGVEWFEESIPKVILDTIQEVCHRKRAP